MELIKKKHERLEHALSALDEAVLIYGSKIEYLKTLDSSDGDEIRDSIESDLDVTCDACIKRFEYAHDMLWQYLGDYLVHECGLRLTDTSPRSVVRTMAKAGFVTEDESALCIEMIETRKVVVDLYDEAANRRFLGGFPGFHTMIRALVERCVPDRLNRQ